MKDAQPLVTVIVVTLNNLNLLRNCLRSLYAQDYASMEIVVVDNGSTDQTRETVYTKINELPITV